MWPPSTRHPERAGELTISPAELIASRLPDQRAGGIGLLGIDGRSGAGKTRLADEVAQHLHTRGRGVTVLSMDELYAGWGGLADVGMVLCRDVMTAISSQHTPQVRRYDWHTEQFGPVTPLPVTDVLIVEGVGSTVHPCREVFDVTVWVQAPRATRLARAHVRPDQGDYAAHAVTWERQEVTLFGPDRYPEPAAGYDIVIDSSLGTWAITSRDAE
ncbi:MAG: hypothetical protein WBG76_03045 [Ornithinimicrobium sp.]